MGRAGEEREEFEGRKGGEFLRGANGRECKRGDGRKVALPETIMSTGQLFYRTTHALFYNYNGCWILTSFVVSKYVLTAICQSPCQTKLFCFFFLWGLGFRVFSQLPKNKRKNKEPLALFLMSKMHLPFEISS